MNPDRINIKEIARQPDYVGSVQRLYFLKEKPGAMVCETTSGGSVFDVGTIFSIDSSDKCRAAFRHKIFSLITSPDAWKNVRDVLEKKLNKKYFEYLSDVLNDFVEHGAKTHHLGMIDAESGKIFKKTFPKQISNYILVKRYQVHKPARLEHASNNLWDYHAQHVSSNFVIPLENIVRFGVTPGSSIFTKFKSLNADDQKKYLKELGLKKEMKAWQIFDNPIIDFTTKYEPEDRSLSLQEALYISGIDGETFLRLAKQIILGSFLVKEFFEKLSLFLWDIKWELATDGKDLVFVDTIDTDSIRVSSKIRYKGSFYQVHFNKQSMRDYYKIIHPDWYAAINESKALAKTANKSFHRHLSEGQRKGKYPQTPEVEKDFLEIQKEKFEVLLSYILEKKSADIAKKELNKIGKEEILFYEKKKVFQQYCSLQKISHEK
ncbi:MAG: phosphoribosylaminoimidazolesuccinocarboxamide synthase [Nitrospirota bacterium]